LIVSSQYGVELATTLVATVDVDEVFEEVETVEERVIEDVTDESPETFCAMPSSNERKVTILIGKSRIQKSVKLLEKPTSSRSGEMMRLINEVEVVNELSCDIPS